MSAFVIVRGRDQETLERWAVCCAWNAASDGSIVMATSARRRSRSAVRNHVRATTARSRCIDQLRFGGDVAPERTAASARRILGQRQHDEVVFDAQKRLDREVFAAHRTSERRLTNHEEIEVASNADVFARERSEHVDGTNVGEATRDLDESRERAFEDGSSIGDTPLGSGHPRPCVRNATSHPGASVGS